MSKRSRGHLVKFTKPGPMLMAKAFWGLDFMVDSAPPDLFRVVDDVAIVDICGPLTHHDEFSWFGGFESYDHILECALAAIESKHKAVLLCIDSPGGDVAGCFETARAIREAAAKAGKPLFAYVDGMAASGGYALACAAPTIAAPETAFVGSIGVIEGLLDVTAADAAYGTKFTIVTSGERKADGNPHVQTSEAMIAAVQADVDSLAQVFFRWVSESRSMSVDEIAALEAGIFHGEKARASKLIDIIADEKVLLAMIAGENVTASAVGKAAIMADDKEEKEKTYAEEMRAKLEEDSKSDDEEKASAAKKMLEALDGDGDKDDTEEPGAEKDEPEPEKKEARTGRRASVATPRGVADLASVVRANVSSEVAIALEAERKRSALVAKVQARPDLTPEKKAKLIAKPVEQIEEHLELLGDPKPGVNLAAADFVATTNHEGTRDADARMPKLPKAQHDDMRERMGQSTQTAKVFSIGTKRFFPSIDKKEAQAMLDRNNAAGAAVNGGK